MCPITHEMLQDPVVCPQCGQSFSADALQTYLRQNPEGRCPICNVNVGGRGWTRNIVLRDLIQSMGAHQLRAESLGGNTFVYTRPFVIIIVGSFGSGKSTLINLLVDPSGNRIIAEEAASARGCTQRAEKVFSGEVDHNGTSRLLELIDTPGFGDPDKSDAQTIRELSRATVDIVAGVDLFVHVVKKDRMGYIDRFLPEIILSGLADDDEAQKEIARRYVFVVTHADSARQPVEQASLDEFKGAMKAFFPDILKSAVQNAVFVENGRNLGTSPLGNPVANRDLILDRAMEARELYHRVFKSKSVEKIIQKGFEDAMEMWKHMDFNGHHVRQIEPEELGALLNFFKKVIERKAWIEMTPATTSCSEFRQAWNKISLAVRDQVAVKVAESVKHQVEESCNKSWTEKIGSVAFSFRGSLGVATGAAASAVIGAAHLCVVS